MKAKDIIKNVCMYLGKEDILQSNIFKDGGQEPEPFATLEVDKMVECLNLINEEIAFSYLPIIKEKEIKLKNGEIEVKDIDENIMEIIGIKTKLGKNVKYRYANNKIVCLATNVIVRYKVYPEKVTIDSLSEEFGGLLSERIIAYGVASEYCYLEMLYDDATVWESRFKNALLFSSRKKGEIVLKKRVWF